jgi:hypothetical protein
MGISYNTSIVRDGLVLYLDAANKKSYPGTGTSWTDLSGAVNNGTLTNGPVFDSENNGNVIFDGIDDWVSTSLGASVNHLFCDSSNQFTVITWFKPSGSDGIICGCAGGLGTVTAFVQYMSGTTFSTRCRGNTSENVIKTNLDTSVFHMGAFTWDGTTGLGYYNNESPVTIGIGTANNQNRLFGIADPAQGLLGNYPRFSGAVGISQIYNRALTSEEIKQNFEALRGRYGI